MSTKRSKLRPPSVYGQKPWLKHYDFWVPAEINFPRQPIHQILDLAALLFTDRPATAFGEAQLTFAEIKAQVERLATALARLGIAKGDRVGIMLPNCPQYVISFFAIVRLGAIVANVNPIYTPREVEMVARDSGMRAIITLDALAATVLSIQAQSQIEQVITTSLEAYSADPQVAGPAPLGALSFSELIAGVEQPDLPRVEIDAERDVAVLQYTGGTTGVPKGAMLSHANLYAAIVQCSVWGSYLTERGAERILLVIPYFHVYGMVIGALFGVWCGAMQILIPKYDVNLLLDAIKRHQPTYFPGVPTLFISLLNHPDAKSYGLGRVRRFNSGSAPLPLEVIEQFERLSGAMLYEGYGMTETAALGTTTPTFARRKPGSIGLPVTGTECKIVDLENGERELPAGEEGELCMRGPQVMLGYWNKPEETALALRDGWLHTGDVARMDEDGYFYIVQRKKDMIIVSGFNVYPNEVEDVLFTHPAVKEAAVIGVPCAYRGEAVKAFIILKPETPAAAEELIAYCREKLARYKVPSFIEFVESLPKSAVGKVLRRELREAEEARRNVQ
ncbi:MAG TPA: long-chain fatty acid--CoA ligase [Blastocatellia bacterium]|nr:long-chain fatty acid--CoA ligase [Blastocatellia bacterium]